MELYCILFFSVFFFLPLTFRSLRLLQLVMRILYHYLAGRLQKCFEDLVTSPEIHQHDAE